MNKRETRVGACVVGVVMATARGVTPVPIWRHSQAKWGEMHPRYSANIHQKYSHYLQLFYIYYSVYNKYLSLTGI